MRVLLWHGWLLEGAGSNIYTARVAEELAKVGHDVLLLCQERHPERYPWIDAWGTIGAQAPPEISSRGASRTKGRCVLLRPEIGTLLPVFVLDEYEGFEVKRFVDLTDDELERYLERNAAAMRAAAAWHGSEAVITGHAVPGGEVGRRALGPGAYVTKIHGSDLEYAIRPQERYRRLARDGLGAAIAVTGTSRDALARCAELVPGIEDRLLVVPPGVDTDVFRPAPRREALLEAARRLELDPETERGRPAELDQDVAEALGRRDAAALDELADTYDQSVPDPGAAEHLRLLADRPRDLVGYFGKLIPQKGVDLLLAGAAGSERRPALLVVGFGRYREWLTALAAALRDGDAGALSWLAEAGGTTPLAGRTWAEPAGDHGQGLDVTFTGRLDHRYAPGALAAMDVLVVPSILDEAFGMVAAEGAAAGALPLVARHSGLAEVAATLEAAVGRPGLFSFEPGGEAARAVASGLDRLLAIPTAERAEMRRAIRASVVREWSWRGTATRLLDAARA
jgi:glycosyltransferase involved in cell wall biosynthesis